MHGFHSYPARLHPQTAASIVQTLSPAGGVVLDPFCGSGTSLVEARRLGRRGVGSDLNPLALELAWLKTLAPQPDFVAQLKGHAEAIAEFGDERRLTKAGPLKSYSQATRRTFPIHVLLELDSLWHGVQAVREKPLRRCLTLVLSSLLTKVSHQKSDTSAGRAPLRLASGFTLELFANKARELGEQLTEYASLLPGSAPKTKLYERDARQLSVLPSKSVDLVITSPPYPGVFDYLEHHRVRLGFLGMSDKSIRTREIGARRNYKDLGFREADAQWREEFRPCLVEFARLLRPGGFAALVIADSAVGGDALRADEQIARWVENTSLELVMTASQRRPNFHRQSQRAFRQQAKSEHLLLLERRR